MIVPPCGGPIVELDGLVGRRHERDAQRLGRVEHARLEHADAVERCPSTWCDDDDVRGLRAQLVERLDRRARGLDRQARRPEQLRQLAERFRLRVCDQRAEPPLHRS